MQSGEKVAEITDAHNEQVLCVSTGGPRDATMLSVARDGVICILDVRAWKHFPVGQHNGFVPTPLCKPALSADGSLLAAPSADGRIYLWPTYGEEKPLVLSQVHTSPLHACAWEASTRMLAAAGADRSVTLWETAT